MIRIHCIEDLALIKESVDLDSKLAPGHDDKEALPQDFWLTYSAFANSQGGLVLLSVRERHQILSIVGIPYIAKVRRELFDSSNNRQKASTNLLTNEHVRKVQLEGGSVLTIEMPRATRKQRSVYLTTNPFSGHTYRRLNDGERAVPDDEVKRILVEQVEDSRDDRILRGYDLPDLDLDTFKPYRQVFFVT